MEIAQAPAPEQAPLHPAKVDPAFAVAVKVTVVPPVKFALQVPGQLMPPGALVSEPDLLPAKVTDRGKLTVTALNVAVTDCAAFILMLQAPAPEQAPLHPAKVDPAFAVAVKVTAVPAAKFALQVREQLMPPGTLVSEPEPLPENVTDRVKLEGTVLKVAVTDCAALMVTLQTPVPVQAPLQPAKVDPAVAAAVKVTAVPLLKFTLQVLGQLIPEGALVTEPEPARVTVRGKLLVPQFGKLKLAMRVFHLMPLVLMYSWVYQKVQSSTGSTDIAL
jgi:hypothetical protein